MKQKRGIAPLVATVLLILITIAAVGVIWGMVIPLIRTNVEASRKCMDARVEVNVEKGFTWFDNETKNLSIMISNWGTLPKAELAGMKVKVVTDKGISYMVNWTAIPGPGEDYTEVFNLTSEELEKGTPSYAAVAAIVRIGEITRSCTMTPEVKIPLRA